MIGSPFTVGLSLPVRLDYQYTFLSQAEIDEARMTLETSENNIVFRGFRNKKCQGVLQYLVRVYEFREWESNPTIIDAK